MTKARPTQTITLNCGHKYTHNLTDGQLGIPFWLAPGHPYTCVDCWKYHGYEGARYLVEATDNDPEPTPEPEADTDTTEQAHCTRCGHTLTAVESIARGYGPTCWSKVRHAAEVTDFTAFKDAKAARAKAEELIEQAAIVPLRAAGTYLATSSDGAATYLVDVTERFCACKGWGHHRRCYHLAAADILSATTYRAA